MSPPVSKDDTITVPKFEGSDRTVNWSQRFMTKSATYVVLEFVVIKKASSGAIPSEQDQVGGILFVEKAKLDEFKQKAVTGSPNTFIITPEFEFGQKNSTGTERWLVYHNKDYEMFQHRFFDKWNWISSPDAANLAKKFGFDAVLSGGAEKFKEFVGNKLENF